MAKDLHLDIVNYHFDPAKDNVPVNAAIAKANSMMHDIILSQLTGSIICYITMRLTVKELLVTK